MSTSICAYLQPVWTILHRKLLLFALTPETHRISAASMTLSGLTTQMGNYMRRLEVTRSPEPTAYFDPSRVADFYPLHAEDISDAEMDSKPPFPNFIGLAQRLLGATWVHSPVVGPLIVYSPSPSPALAASLAPGLDETCLLLPPAAPAGHPEDRLHCFVEVPPRPSKSRKAKGKHKVAALGDACSKCPRLEVTPEAPEPLVVQKELYTQHNQTTKPTTLTRRSLVWTATSMHYNFHATATDTRYNFHVVTTGARYTLQKPASNSG
ncbi:hypothetical protein BDZ97DRAFT_1760694 [Flammula alnicola]|nr:hypothetical protein BDZ97DRAFT_1760694 [Flammula alnicola]